MLTGKRILLIIGGGIAAFKMPELIRLLRAEGVSVTPVLTGGAKAFVTPLTISTLAGEAVHDALFDLTREAEIGHIQLSRAADLLVVAPATADLMAKMAGGQADDLASTLLLATDKRVLVVPAMNVRMWNHPATQRNVATLRGDGVLFAGPVEGDMACGEHGPGRMVEPSQIVAAIRLALGGAPAQIAGPEAEKLVPGPQKGGLLADRAGLSEPVRRLRGPLSGRHVLVTSGPTHEPIDPVRYIANRSSGAQGTAIAAALRDLGAKVSFITGPAEVPPPEGVEVIRVETAREMLAAVRAALPADAAVFAAAVADWRVKNAADQKMKKDGSGTPPALDFAENPDILATISRMGEGRPPLVVGFAAETQDVIRYATEKRARKGCDWIVANDVSPETGIMGGNENAVTLITARGAESWERMSKAGVAGRLADRIALALETRDKDE